MVHTLENIKVKVGEGSIKIGATGTVSALMMRELDSKKLPSQTSVPCKRKTQTGPVSISCGVSTKRLNPRRASSSCGSSSMSNTGQRRSGTKPRKSRNNLHTIHHMPMLGSEDISVDRTPIRCKAEKKGPQMVEIVDFKCGMIPDGDWSSPISNQLRRLSFSRLSD